MFHHTYLINDCVYFRTSDFALWASSDREEMTSIGVVQGRLLGYLLLNTDRVISRDELLERVWVDYGLRPSGASLNQHMSIIRKYLMSLGVSEDLIRTIPKLGYMVEGSYIKEIENNPAMLDKPHPNIKVIRCAGKLKHLTLTFMLILFFSIWLGLKITYTRDDIPDFKIHPLMNVNGCAVYSSINGAKTLDDYNRKLISSIIATMKCSEDSFYIFIGDSSKLFHDKKGGVFFSRCYLNNKNPNLLSECDSTYEQDYEKK
jgi:DNA-binding winged helix-turn-helix (wHTH) protein